MKTNKRENGENRPAKARLFEMIDEGLPAEMVIMMCLKWMSEDDVSEMIDANELSERFDEVMNE